MQQHPRSSPRRPRSAHMLALLLGLYVLAPATAMGQRSMSMSQAMAESFEQAQLAPPVAPVVAPGPAAAASSATRARGHGRHRSPAPSRRWDAPSTSCTA